MFNKRKKMKILITGGAGYIGFHLSQYLLKNKNIKIDILDDLSNSSEILVKKLKKNKNFDQFFKINI
jgi:UDP-glucose 4-epimerase